MSSRLTRWLAAGALLLALAPRAFAGSEVTITDEQGRRQGTPSLPLSVTVTNPSSGGSGGTVTQGPAGSTPWPAVVAQYNASLPALSSGSTAYLDVDSSGRLILAPSSNVAVSNFPASQAVTNTGAFAVQASQAGSWTVGLGTGSNAIGTVGVTSLPALPAGTAIVGKVGIDQTTPGTTNGVQVVGALPAGSNAIGSVSVSNFPSTQAVSAATLPLPTGAATAANQANTFVAPYGGAVTIGTSQAMLVGCATATSTQTVANSQGSAIQCDTHETLKVTEAGSPDSTVGITPSVATGATSLVGKGSGGNLYGAYAYNTSATASFLVAINAASVPAASSAISPVECVPLPATGSATVNYGAGPPDAYSTGIVLLVSTSCTTYTAGGASFIKVRVR